MYRTGLRSRDLTLSLNDMCVQSAFFTHVYRMYTPNNYKWADLMMRVLSSHQIPHWFGSDMLYLCCVSDDFCCGFWCDCLLDACIEQPSDPALIWIRYVMLVLCFWWFLLRVLMWLSIRCVYWAAIRSRIDLDQKCYAFVMLLMVFVAGSALNINFFCLKSIIQFLWE